MTTHATAPQERFSLLDALRGFAILGIFGVNMIASAFLDDTSKVLYYNFGKADEIFKIAIDALVEGKFYSMFSLLFGIGFGLQLSRHHRKGVDGLPLFKRRLWGLIFIGIMHMLFIWVGDILFLYAWLGFVLIAFRHKSDRYLLNASLFCLAMPVLLYPLRLIHPYINLGTPLFAIVFGIAEGFGIDIEKMDFVSFFGSPGWAHYFKANILSMFFRQADLFDQVRPFKVFSMFLLGFWVSRHRWYATPEVFLEKAKPYVWFVFPVALAINVGMALISWGEYYQSTLLGGLKTVLYFLGVVPLSLCYIYFFVQSYLSGGYKFLHPFTYVGRMALTNYLMHSVLYMVIFRGPFFGLVGQVGYITCMLPVLLFFPVQVIFSKWWLSRYQFGPAEWLWRSMTYGKWQEMKRE
jgi:uncharacterized protein